MAEFTFLTRGVARARWVALLGAALSLSLGYLWFQPLAAQEKARTKAPPAAAEKAKAAPADAGTLTQQEIDRRAEEALAASEADPKETKAPDAARSETLDILKDIKWLSPHMWAVYAILLVSLVSVTFAIERLLGLRRSKVLPTDLVAGLRALAGRKGEFDVRHALRLCKQYPSSAAVVVRTMLAKVGRPVLEIEHAMSEAADREASRLYANVRWQTLAFNVAPMLGLAGTVHGVIIAFFVTAHMPLGMNKMEGLATGIYAALVCTFVGLIVAIPAGVFAHFFEGRILKYFQEIDDVTRPLLGHLERFEGRPRVRLQGEKPAGELAPLDPPSPDDPDEDDQQKWPAVAPRK